MDPELPAVSVRDDTESAELEILSAELRPAGPTCLLDEPSAPSLIELDLGGPHVNLGVKPALVVASRAEAHYGIRST